MEIKNEILRDHIVKFYGEITEDVLSQIDGLTIAPYENDWDAMSEEERKIHFKNYEMTSERLEQLRASWVNIGVNGSVKHLPEDLR